jgi:hypothetical protein
MAFYSAWFIGSATIAAQPFLVGAGACNVAAGTYYLTDPTSALSLLAQMQTTILAQAAGASVVLLASGKVRISATGAFALTWGTSTTLRDLLGFNADLAALNSYTAPLKSKLWWSPGKPALFGLSPLGVTGQNRYIVSQSVSAYTGKAESTSHGSRVYQRFPFEKVDSERIKAADTDAAAGGEYEAWFAQVAVKSARFKVYRDVTEDSTSTTAFAYDSVHGPYIQPLGSDASYAYQRSAGLTWTDLCADITITANGCPEIE